VKRLTGLDSPLWASAVCLLALTLAGAVGITHFDDRNVGFVLLLQALPYAVAAWLIVSGKPDAATGGRALATILIVGLAMRLLLLPGTPISTDIFRYMWDGRVQAAGINPYLYLPSDAALTGLRDSVIYPYINRADYAPTIYPPASQMIFYLVTRISEAPMAMKAAMVALEGVAVWAILQLLAARGLPRSRVLLYAWHPLPLWEFARSGHIDIAAIAFLLLAFLAMERRSPILAGMALGWGDVADAAVPVLVIVPVHEAHRPMSRRLQVGKPLGRELGPVFHGAELTFRIGIVVGNMGPRMCFSDAEVGHHRLGELHLVTGRLAGRVLELNRRERQVDAELRGLGGEPFVEHGGFTCGTRGRAGRRV